MTMKTSLLTTLTFQVLLSTAFAQTPTRPAPAAHDMTTAASTVAGPADAPNDYRLNPGDKLAIDVHEDKSLSETLQIRPDGKITLPLVGDIPAAGRTTNDLRGAIAAALKEYIAQPTVTVIVQETAPQVVYVMGEVSKPGPQVLNGPLTVMQALATAGGFTDFANRKDIKILHRTPTGIVQMQHFNYKDALDTGLEGPMLHPGDTVVVK